MTIFFVILIIVASIILGLIVLVQNPKGGGLAGNIAGFSNQFMGVKQTTDVLEKGTWLFAAIIGILCLVSTLFISGRGGSVPNKLDDVGNTPIRTNTPGTSPNTFTVPPNSTTPAKPDSNK